jgi:hypothetical protein
MINKTTKKLIQQRNELQNRLDSIHYADADPHMKSIYQSDLQYNIVKIEEEIEFERTMMPFKACLLGFVIGIVGIITYFLTLN